VTDRFSGVASKVGGMADKVGISGGSKKVRVEKKITVQKPAEEVYHFWRNLENLPRFMSHLEEVRTINENKSHWKAKGPMGSHVEWDAVITNERPNERISWKSLGGADVPNSGTVVFQQDPDGISTEVRVSLEYQPPGGQAGAMLAKLFGEEPQKQLEDDLNKFKEVIESGATAGGGAGRM
jgi:uncharacterized membrane protein